MIGVQPGCSISAMRVSLASHPVFRAIGNLDDLRTFMEWHVFAVWDFMSLVKRLQVELSVTSIPWIPPLNSNAARLINEIVLGEETDQTCSGPMSHFELYLLAMREIGASTKKILAFVTLLKDGVGVQSALSIVDAPAHVQRFVIATIDICLKGSIHEVMGYFYYGRESVIPEMFRALLKQWGIKVSDVATLVFYLERHIEIDSGGHGPAAEQIINEIAKGDPELQQAVLTAGRTAIENRLELWNGLLEKIQRQQRDYIMI